MERKGERSESSPPTEASLHLKVKIKSLAPLRLPSALRNSVVRAGARWDWHATEYELDGVFYSVIVGIGMSTVAIALRFIELALDL
jgi:hypothetical protein